MKMRSVHMQLSKVARWIQDIAVNTGKIEILWYAGQKVVANASYVRHRVVDTPLHEEIARTNPEITFVSVKDDSGTLHSCTIVSTAMEEDANEE